MNPSHESPNIIAEWTSAADATARIKLAGRLDASTLAEAWRRTVPLARKAHPRTLTVDAAALTYCDGAGLGLFAELRRIATEADGQVTLEIASADLRQLIDMASLADPAASVLHPPRRPGLVIQVGNASAALWDDLAQIVAFTGRLTVTLAWAARHPRRIRGRDALRVAEKAGVNALPVVALLGFLVGLILAFQTVNPLRRYGGESLVPTLVAVAVVREMGPLITAIILAGRSGSAFAAEIGTMKVTEELAALETMGLDPTRFLVLPRVLAAVLVTPLLTVFNILLSIAGGYVVMAGLGYSLSSYVNAVAHSINYVDLLGGIFKGLVFGLIVAAIGCLRGVQTRSGPGAVGDSTTRAVVAGIVLTIAADAVLGVVYFVLRI